MSIPDYSEIISEMIYRNKNTILTNGLKYDSKLYEERDARLGFAIFAFFKKDEYSGDFQGLHDNLVSKFQKQIVYSIREKDYKSKNSGMLHFTLFQICGVKEDLSPFYETHFQEYISAINDALQDVPPFTIRYTGVAAIPSGVMMYGTPDYNINIIRDRLRDIIPNKNLLLEEPYKNNIAHSTCVRLRDTLTPDQFINSVDSISVPKNLLLHVKTLKIGFGTWRMRPSEIDIRCEIKL